jgi:hypothetical protein
MVGLEPTISVGMRPWTYVLDRAATGTGTKAYYKVNINAEIQYEYTKEKHIR